MRRGRRGVRGASEHEWWRERSQREEATDGLNQIRHRGGTGAEMGGSGAAWRVDVRALAVPVLMPRSQRKTKGFPVVQPVVVIVIDATE